MLDYYSIRRVNPYLGLLQVIDLGPVRAYCDDGQNWRVRRVFDMEVHWSQYNPGDKVSRQAVKEAIDRHPSLPFPRRDNYELWLLRKSDQRPLALLRSCVWPEEMEPVTDPRWIGFAGMYAGFTVEGLARGDDPRERLVQMIRWAAFPQPVVQWFQRHEDGSGTGLDGMRVEPALQGRHLPAEEFPPLLISEHWQDEEEAALARGFHDWYAATLLAHPDLSETLRSRLESAVLRNPVPLLESYRIIPGYIDKRRLDVAMVAARMIKNNTY
ncbi:MAG: hypothetical protein HUJ29_03450 [Gammaproteobacteria bacterium]|nr:hypothetical protein [Gammaproteobacteria bacterium]